MTDLVLRDIDPDLAARIQRLSKVRGWTMHDTLRILLDQGLQACESGLDVHFDDKEDEALTHAISALEHVADDTGFGLIGRAPPPPPPQHILDRWAQE